MTAAQYDLVIIGSGPGGEVGAIRAAQLGLKVALVEKAAHLGGTCLNVGCIPTKSLLGSASTYVKLQHAKDQGFETGEIKYNWAQIMARKDKVVDGGRKGLLFLMKKNKVDVIWGLGRLKSATEVEVVDKDKKVTVLQTKNILLATGSRVAELPFAPSNGRNILTSDSVLFIDHVPKTMAVIGAGVVGVEFANCFARFGTKVTVIELAERILPTEDEETVDEAMKSFKKQGIVFETSTKLTGLKDKGQTVEVQCEGKAARDFDRVLVAIGRRPVLEDLGLDKLKVVMEKSFVKVDAQYRTSLKNIFAIGDIISTPALAHTASAEAIQAVEVIAGHKPTPINYDANPNAVYTYPEIASIGKTEAALKAAKIDYKVAKFPFAPMAKAKIEDATEGFVKILHDSKFGEILGVHIIGAKATEMIAEFVVGKVLETTVEELAQCIHPHPTISEAAMEAAHAAVGGAIHI
ncbi:MAG: dihydrolipoyl dehydrogenase [Oligoflexales bacterium]|nr:dihydrolipoyl dehydrogenase [Oligoflexales bacterium]